MVSQLINVIVSSTGAVTVRKQLNDIGNSARTTTTYLNSLRSVLAAALTFSGVTAISDVADNFTVLQNRLRQVADESRSVGESWQELIQIANQSYSTIDSTVNLYFRVAQAYKAWGKSAEEAYEFTELFQKSAILSGSAVQTTAQAVYQFSQALNKGKLDGDEFRSVLEGLPYVASLIQKSLGVTRAELYAMSADGKISVERIKKAFEDAAETIRNDFQNITPTIGMAITVLKNNWVDFVGSIQTSTGVFSGIAQLILLIANNFGVLAAALAPVVASLAYLGGRLVLGLVVTGFRDMSMAISRLIPMIIAFNAALLANPIILIATLIAGAVAALIYFRDEIGLTDEVLSQFWQSAKQVFNDFLDAISPMTGAISRIVVAFKDWLMSFELIRKIANITLSDIGNMFSSIQSFVAKTAKYLLKEFGGVIDALVDLFSALGELIQEIVGLYVDLLSPAIETLSDQYKEWWTYLEPVLINFIQFLTDILRGWTNIASYLAQTLGPVIQDIFGGWIIIIKEVIGFIQSLIEGLKQAVQLMRSVTGSGPGSAPTDGPTPGANYGAQFNAGEFATGGRFKVGGTGNGRDTTPVAFRANRGERVTVETKKQQRQADNNNGMGAANVNVPVSITNVFDPNMVPDAINSAKGQQTVMNVIAANRDEITSILGVR